MNRASDWSFHAEPIALFVAPRQRCSSRHPGFHVAPRQYIRRADTCPVSRCPKRVASRTCVCACDVRDVRTRRGARRERVRAHLSFFPWDSGTVGRNKKRGER